MVAGVLCSKFEIERILEVFSRQEISNRNLKPVTT